MGRESKVSRGQLTPRVIAAFEEGREVSPAQGEAIRSPLEAVGRLPSAKEVLNVTHGKLVFSRRVRELSAILATTLPKDAKVLDVGAGDGSIASNIMKQRADLSIEGVDVFQRPTTQIPVAVFDGRHLPFADSSFDCVLFVDVLHHTDDASELVREAARVANDGVVIEDRFARRNVRGSNFALHGLGGESRARRRAALQLSAALEVGPNLQRGWTSSRLLAWRARALSRPGFLVIRSAATFRGTADKTLVLQNKDPAAKRD